MSFALERKNGVEGVTNPRLPNTGVDAAKNTTRNTLLSCLVGFPVTFLPFVFGVVARHHLV